MKTKASLIVFLFFILGVIISCETTSKSSFELKGKIRGNYNGYLFFELQGRKDSVLIRNGEYSYKGIVDYPTRTWISTEGTSTIEDVIFVEKGKITADLHIESKEVQGYNVYFITYDTIINSNIQKQQLAFVDFQNNNENKSDYKLKYFEEAKKIITQNKKNEFSADFLYERTFDSILSKKELQELFNVIEPEYQEKDFFFWLKTKAFPKPAVVAGSEFPFFELPNKNGDIINVKEHLGDLTYIDFWASWCLPCRKQFPDLKKIIANYSNTNFKVIGVSLDDDRDKWLNTDEKENIPWLSLIDTLEFKNIAANLSIRSIPTNFLINAEGVVIEKNLDMDELNQILEEYYNK